MGFVGIIAAIGIAIFVLIFFAIKIIMWVRGRADAATIKKAEAFLAAGEKQKAVALFTKSLMFQLGDEELSPVLEKVIGIYQDAGCSEELIQKMRDVYQQLHEGFRQELKEIENRKMDDNKRIDAISDLDKQYQDRFKKEFASLLASTNLDG